MFHTVQTDHQEETFENLHLTIINNNFSSSQVHMTVDVNIMNVLGSHRI